MDRPSRVLQGMTASTSPGRGPDTRYNGWGLLALPCQPRPPQRWLHHVLPVLGAINAVANSQLANSVVNAMSNVVAHYDLGNVMFSSFLDETMTYSCAIWRSPEDSLHDGQIRKLKMVIDKARIVRSDHVLEIGSGWGSFAMLVHYARCWALLGCDMTAALFIFRLSA